MDFYVGRKFIGLGIGEAQGGKSPTPWGRRKIIDDTVEAATTPCRQPRDPGSPADAHCTRCIVYHRCWTEHRIERGINVCRQAPPQSERSVFNNVRVARIAKQQNHRGFQWRYNKPGKCCYRKIKFAATVYFDVLDKTVVDRGSRSDRPRCWVTTPIHAGYRSLTLTYDLDFQSQASCGHDPHTHNLKFKGQSVKKKEWEQTDGRTNATHCFTFPANAVGKHRRFMQWMNGTQCRPSNLAETITNRWSHETPRYTAASRYFNWTDDYTVKSRSSNRIRSTGPDPRRSARSTLIFFGCDVTPTGGTRAWRGHLPVGTTRSRRLREIDGGESVDIVILAPWIIDLFPSHEADQDTRVHHVRQLHTSQAVQHRLHVDARAKHVLLSVIIRLEVRLRPNIRFTVFTRSALTPSKVNRFGWNLEHSEYIVGC